MQWTRDNRQWTIDKGQGTIDNGMNQMLSNGMNTNKIDNRVMIDDNMMGDGWNQEPG